MKLITRITSAAAVCLAAFLGTSCINDLQEQSMPEFITGITVSSEDLDFSGLSTPGTKVKYDPSLRFSFSIGDRLGIFPIGGEQAAFPLSKLEADGSAKFDGGAWALRSSYEYAAYYPQNPDKYDTQDMYLPVTFRNQHQTGNNSTDGLGPDAFLFSKASKPDAKGNVTIEMKQCAGVVRLAATLPQGVDVTKVIFRDVTQKLRVDGLVNLNTYSHSADEYPAITNTRGGEVTVDITDLTTADGTNNLIVYLWLPPQNLVGHEMQMEVQSADGMIYLLNTTPAGLKIEAAKGKGVTFGAYITDNSGGCEAVDLGLSVKWASWNIGASKPEDYGKYFAWGEIADKANYDWSKEGDYKWGVYDSEASPECGMTKYTADVEGGDGLKTLQPGDDPATMNWGSKWRTPTSEEIQELLDKTKCEWTWDATRKGYTVKGLATGNSIFLPATGRISGSDFSNSGGSGNYWSSSLSESTPHNARYFFFTAANYQDWSAGGRYYGRSVRAVTEE